MGCYCCAWTFPLHVPLWYLSWTPPSLAVWLLSAALALLSFSLTAAPLGFLFRCFIFPTSAFIRELCLLSGRDHPSFPLCFSPLRGPLGPYLIPYLTLLLLPSFVPSFAISSPLGHYLPLFRLGIFLRDKRAPAPGGTGAYSLGPWGLD